jgi:hypothetical protein
MITCGHCGWLVSPEIKKGKYVYYSCTNAKGNCHRDYINKAVFLKEISQYFDDISKGDEGFHVTANMVLSLAKRARQIFESSEVEEKRLLLNFVFQNLELKDKKLLIHYREPFKMIKDTSLMEKCPGMYPSADSFRTFKDFDWSRISLPMLLTQQV